MFHTGSEEKTDQSPCLSNWTIISLFQWMFSLLSLIVIKPGCSAPQNLHRRLQHNRLHNTFTPEQYSFVSLETNPTELLFIFSLCCLFSFSTHSPAHIRRQQPDQRPTVTERRSSTKRKIHQMDQTQIWSQNRSSCSVNVCVCMCVCMCVCRHVLMWII